MGLDMYLTRRQSVRNWSHEPEDKKFEVIVKRGGKTLKSKMEPTTIVYEAAYWRKANQIHNWFVNNVSGGDDHNGEEIWVPRAKLVELVDLCNEVLRVAKLGKGKVKNGERYNANLQKWEPIYEEGVTVLNPEEIGELLPPTSGFFFGSTEINGWFIDDVKSTVNQITAALEDSDEGDEFYYEGNW